MMYFDGGCTPNPGMMEVCVVIDDKAHHQTQIGKGTNNQAEWLSLLWGLELAVKAGITDVEIRGDSMLVVNQANGVWQCRDAHLKTFLAEYHQLRKKFNRVNLVHVRRAQNLAGIAIEKAQKG